MFKRDCVNDFESSFFGRVRLCVSKSLVHMSTNFTNSEVALWGQVFKRCIIILTLKQQRQITYNQPESCYTGGLLGPSYHM